MSTENRTTYRSVACLCPDGNTREFLVDKKHAEMDSCLDHGALSGICGYADEKDAWNLFNNISKILVSIHNDGLAHGGISAEHIFLGSDNEMFLENSNIVVGKDKTGPTNNIDPSNLSPQRAACNNVVNSADDVWSIGSVVFHLLMGVKIFNGQGGRVQRRTTPVPVFNASVYSQDLCDLTRRCLSYEPDMRPSLDEIVQLSEAAIKKYDSKLIPRKKSTDMSISIKDVIDYWPEKMEG